MKRITALQPQKRRPDRLNVYLDGEFAFGLDRLVAAWLQVGQELSDEKIAALQAEDEREQAYRQALLLLSYRPRSSREVRQNLEKHGVAEPVIEDVLSRLQTAGLVNDEQFARTWVENRATFRPRSRRALQSELRRKGLPDEVIQSALQGSADDAALAQEAALRYAPRLQHLEWTEFRQKMIAYLGRRGFAYPVAADAVRAAWEQCRASQSLTNDEETP